MFRTRVLVLTGVLATACAAAGCSTTAPRPGVASLPNAEGTGPAVTSTVDGGVPDPEGRPRETLNMTSRQVDALYAPWTACLTQHGLGKKSGTAPRDGQLETAVATCRHLEPLPAWPLDPANPQARAFLGRTVTCLHGLGYQAEAVLRDSRYTGFPGREYWGVQYTPSVVGIRHRTERDENKCKQRAVR